MVYIPIFVLNILLWKSSLSGILVLLMSDTRLILMNKNGEQMKQTNLVLFGVIWCIHSRTLKPNISFQGRLSQVFEDIKRWLARPVYFGGFDHSKTVTDSNSSTFSAPLSPPAHYLNPASISTTYAPTSSPIPALSPFSTSAYFFYCFGSWTCHCSCFFLLSCSCQNPSFIKAQTKGYICISTCFFSSCNAIVWPFNMFPDYWK